MIQNPSSPALNRIVVGDVGSGKTIVAFLVALIFLRGTDHTQVALLAPTEVLARQHYESFLKFYTKTQPLESLNIVFLTSKSVIFNHQTYTKAAFAKFMEKSKPEFQTQSFFWIGTHALLFNQFIKPQLVLVDEQHRFGVRQRQSLAQHGAHFISFTATPIPRTLALTVFKYLQPLFLQTLSTRHPIQTSVQTFENLERVIPIMKNTIQNGKKVFIICPNIEEGVDEQAWSVAKAYTFFEQHFPDQILTTHGKRKDKQEVLMEFKDSKTKNILIATTVIEVGVDVTEATLMVIMNAEKFGLATLHQIRGRVGRNNYQNNSCILMTDKKYARSRRLSYIQTYTDGFVLAQKDLELRGSGDLYGKLQSGFDSDEIEEFLGLFSDSYEQIAELVDSIEMENLEQQLPRLHNYIQKQIQEVWKE